MNYEEQTPQAICASNNLSGDITPESVGRKLKKGTYNLNIWLFNNWDFYKCNNGYMAFVVFDWPVQLMITIYMANVYMAL